MISKSLIEMIKGRWREFVREPSAIIFVITMPVIWMVVLGLAFSGERQEKFSVGVISETPLMDDQLNLDQIIALKESPSLIVQHTKKNDQHIALKAGKIVLAVEWNAANKSLQYTYDPSNPTAVHAKNAVNDIIQKANGRQDPIPTEDIKISAVGSRYIDFLIPGLLALSIVTTSLFGTGMTFVLHRRDKLLKLYLTTPMNSYEYLISHIIGRYLMFAVEFITIFLAGYFLFDFKISGEYLAFAMLGTAAFTSLAILFGARGENTGTYNGMVNLLVLPMMMLSGVWFSRASFPNWLHSISDYLPLTALVDGLRKIALEGQTFSQLTFEMSVLAAYTLIGIVIAKSRFKWY